MSLSNNSLGLTLATICFARQVLPPDATPTALNGATGSVGFSSYSPYGFNGRFIYGRVSYSF